MDKSFSDRCEEFFVGLRALSERTRIALCTSESLGACGEMALTDATHGEYRRTEPDVITWTEGPSTACYAFAPAGDGEGKPCQALGKHGEHFIAVGAGIRKWRNWFDDRDMIAWPGPITEQR